MFIRPVKYRKPEDNPYPVHYVYEWYGARGIRWGTSGKLSAIKNHYRDTYGDEEIFKYVGIAADEPSRVKDDTHKLYPLVGWGMTEKNVYNTVTVKDLIGTKTGLNYILYLIEFHVGVVKTRI